MRRRKVHEAGERGAAAGAGAAAMQDSPRLAAQRRQMEQSFGAPVQAVAQRVKDRPDNEVLGKALASCVSSTMGACCKEAAAAYKVLTGFVDSSADLGAVLLTWSENAHSDLDIGNHTACTATWGEGSFVVDTTAGQFGGPEVFIGSVSAWQEMILSRQEGEVGNVSCKALSKPATDGEMISDALDLKYRLSPKKPKVVVPTARPGDKKSGKGGGKGSGDKKSKCYLTSACVAYRGLPDDCHELTVLRAFRDGWLAAQPQGPALIEQYYAAAPGIVDAIEASGVARAIYARVFGVIRSCVASIEAGRPQQAMQHYAALVHGLQAVFSSHPQEVHHGP